MPLKNLKLLKNQTMADYIPFKPNANDAFGFTDPSGITPKSQPDWRWVLVGGVLVVGFVYWYQREQINDLRKELFKVKEKK